MDQREMLRKMAFTALGLVLAIEIVAIAGADAQPAESVYALRWGMRRKMKSALRRQQKSLLPWMRL